MRFEAGDKVIDLGSGAADVIAASTAMTFDWVPAEGNSYEWYHRDHLDETEAGSDYGSMPSAAQGFVSFEAPAPALGCSELPTVFYFDGTSWDDAFELPAGADTRDYSPWTWFPETRTLAPSLSYGGSYYGRFYESTYAEEYDYSAFGESFRMIERGHWELRESPDLVAAGGGGDDILYGGTGEDVLDGGDGNDLIIGGLGATVMTGGVGADTFVFGAGTGMDIVRDFQVGQDQLAITSAERNGVLHGALDLGRSTMLDLGDGHTILLVGVPADLLASQADGMFVDA